jgi:hypothetical protein
MLDRKAIPVLLVLLLVMLVSDIWQVTHAGRWSMAPFLSPVTVTIAAGVLCLRSGARWLLRMLLQPGRSGAAFS